MRVILLMLAVMVAGCVPSQEQSIRIGYNNWPGYELLWLAEELGYFRDAGVRVEHVQFMSLGDSRRAYERGQLDAVGVTAIELLQIPLNSSRQAVAVWVMDVSHGGDQLIAQASIRRVQDLKGKRVAVEPATVSLQLISLALSQAGLSVGDVTLVGMPQSHMKVALDAAEVDAVVSYPPYSTDMLRVGKTHLLFDSAQTPDSIVDLLAVHPDMLTKEPERLRRVLTALARAGDYLRHFPQDAMSRMARHAGMSLPDMNDSLSGLRIPQAQDQPALLAAGGRVHQGIASVVPLLDLLGLSEASHAVAVEDLLTDQAARGVQP